MKPREAIRAVVVTLTAAFLMLLVQPWFYQARLIPLLDVVVEDWLIDKYYPAAAIVLGTSLIAQILWYALALNFRGDERDAEAMRLLWLVLLIAVLVSIGIALFFNTVGTNGSAGAFPSLLAFFLIDVGLIYWLATAIGTPNRALKFIVPGSFYLRIRFFR